MKVRRRFDIRSREFRRSFFLSLGRSFQPSRGRDYLHPDTKYHKALLINYPNDKDLKRFDKAKRQKLIPKNADIGGLIEIHGSGDKGADWTNGCVALKNSDMDIIYREAHEGTLVTIVGSLKPINEILITSEENEN